MPPIQGPLAPIDASIRRSVLTRQRQLTRDAVSGMGFLATFGLTQGFAAAVREAGVTASGQLMALGQVFERVATDTKARTEIHTRVAALARTSVIQSYGQKVTAKEGPASRTHYRAGAGRMAAGKMLQALQAPEFIMAGPDGINYANAVTLDRIAAQWHRLNFGAAGSRRGSAPASFEVTFNNMVLLSLGLPDQPSPGFSLPKGFFRSPEGGVVAFGANAPGSDAFTPGSAGGRAGYTSSHLRALSQGAGAARQTAGIAAKNFLDAGVARIAREIGPAYQGYFRNLFERAKEGKGPLAGKTLVHPRTLPIRARRYR